jgi:vacuolar-type H+-ATPase subunit E/Vma4
MRNETTAKLRAREVQSELKTTQRRMEKEASDRSRGFISNAALIALPTLREIVFHPIR